METQEERRTRFMATYDAMNLPDLERALEVNTRKNMAPDAYNLLVQKIEERRVEKHLKHIQLKMIEEAQVAWMQSDKYSNNGRYCIVLAGDAKPIWEKFTEVCLSHFADLNATEREVYTPEGFNAFLKTAADTLYGQLQSRVERRATPSVAATQAGLQTLRTHLDSSLEAIEGRSRTIALLNLKAQPQGSTFNFSNTGPVQLIANSPNAQMSGSINVSNQDISNEFVELIRLIREDANLEPVKKAEAVQVAETLEACLKVPSFNKTMAKALLSGLDSTLGRIGSYSEGLARIAGWIDAAGNLLGL